MMGSASLVHCSAYRKRNIKANKNEVEFKFSEKFVEDLDLRLKAYPFFFFIFRTYF